MKSLYVFVAAALVCASVANASDLAVKAPVNAAGAPYDWSGFYAGVQGGYGFGNSNHSTPTFPSFTDNFAVKGGLLGATAGYNVQIGAFVYGLEGDASFAWLKGTTGGVPPPFCPPGPPIGICTTKLQGLETVRLRAGFAWDRFLPYLTGGLAIGQIYGATDPGNPNSGSTSKVTWTGGGGVEAAIDRRWSAKLEYLYADFGDARNLFIRRPGAFPFDVSLRTHIVRVGVNYRLN